MMKYEQENIEDVSTVYIEGYLSRKEDDNKWTENWTVVRGKYILIYRYRPELCELRDAFKGCINLTENTKCIAAKRKKYCFPFYIVTQRARYLFKAQSTLSRHQWFVAVQSAAQGKPFQPLPIHLLQPSYNKDNSLITENNDSVDVTDDSLDVTDDPLCVNNQPSNKEVNVQNDLYKNTREKGGGEEEDEKEKEEQEENISNHIIYVSSPKQNNTTFNFLERKVSNNKQETSFVKNDIVVTDFDENAIETRMYDIYCKNELTEPTQRPISYLYPKPTSSTGNPSFSASSTCLLSLSSSSLSASKPSRFSERLIKSADSLRDLPTVRHRYSNAINSSQDNTKLLKNLGRSTNKFACQSCFSRHLIDSTLFSDGV